MGGRKCCVRLPGTEAGRGAERTERAAVGNKRGKYSSWWGVGWGWRWDTAANEVIMSAGDTEVRAALIWRDV